MPHEARLGLLHRDGEDALNLLHRRRHAILDEVHERLDRCETHVAGTGAVGACRLEVVKEGDYNRRIELFEFHTRWCDLQALARVFQEQPEGVGIRVAGINARAAFESQTFVEEGADMGSKSGHCTPPARWASQRSAMLRMSSGTASRYQYVCSALL